MDCWDKAGSLELSVTASAATSVVATVDSRGRAMTLLDTGMTSTPGTLRSAMAEVRARTNWSCRYWIGTRAPAEVTVARVDEPSPSARTAAFWKADSTSENWASWRTSNRACGVAGQLI